jgi:hypothetical protein
MYKNEWVINESNHVPIASDICGVKTEHARFKRVKLKNLSRHTDVFDVVSSSLMKGIQMGEMFKLGWLIGSVKHAIWPDISGLCFYIQFPKT